MMMMMAPLRMVMGAPLLTEWSWHVALYGFVVVNVDLEEPKDDVSSRASSQNGSSSLTRFEFLEMVVRVALAKYPGFVAASSVTNLYNECIVPSVSDRALLDNDFFRYTCLYTEAVGRVFADRDYQLKKVWCWWQPSLVLVLSTSCCVTYDEGIWCVTSMITDVYRL